ncbi:MAG TPA: hypothetical protein VJV78_00360 [Polyangiales bacterium]|nr:hypothetical protein [Polyangiales bacterium]
MRARHRSVALFCALLTWSTGARADQRQGEERIDYTAYTLRRNEFSIGVGAASYGVLDQLTIGTYVLPWFAFPVLRSPVASGYVKLRDWFDGAVSVALRAGFVYLNASGISAELSDNASSDVGFLALPVELSASWRIRPEVSQSLQLSWVHARVSGELPRGATVDTGLGGVSSATSVALGSLTELRLTRVTALFLRGTLLLDLSDIAVRGQYEREGTQVAARLGARPDQPAIVGNVIPGVHFSWSHVNLQLGLGVGTNWLPFVGLPTQVVTVVPDADFYVRF